ncbi:hypothetical protein I2W78_39395 [Streptomyces spinoverrucosus]|uniref:hypothetical protein n=1 Tax=Streptomyces spinoverrucosus TaxID=284043 RepID=UPI0018C4207E|nr:hypothetical protein [Streptomyces spinoverrucosus]MBG0857751.1 hypothetical protein [Streptomyces spinoverrucosus]
MVTDKGVKIDNRERVGVQSQLGSYVPVDRGVGEAAAVDVPGTLHRGGGIQGVRARPAAQGDQARGGIRGVHYDRAVRQRGTVAVAEGDAGQLGDALVGARDVRVGRHRQCARAGEQAAGQHPQLGCGAGR